MFGLISFTPDTRSTKVGTSRLNRAQVDMTLELLSDFVKDTGADASAIIVIARYKANVNYANRELSKYPALSDT
jgi:superfamily I DNA and/or RNA helicase